MLSVLPTAAAAERQRTYIREVFRTYRCIADDLPGANAERSLQKTERQYCAAIHHHVEVSRGRETLRFLPGNRREGRHPAGKGACSLILGWRMGALEEAKSGRRGGELDMFKV